MNKKINGTSALELIVATLILTVAMIPIIMTIQNLRKSISDRAFETKLVLQAQSLMDEIRSKRWDEKSVPIGTYVDTPSVLGHDKESPLDFNDIDDFNGYEDYPEPGIKRKAFITYVTLDKNSAATDSGGVPTNFKRIQIQVSSDKSGGMIKTFETVMANIN